MAYQTEKNLQEAFNGESAAARRYTLFAEKAEKEGQKQASRLFRAAAEAEMVHARNHVNAMDGIGSTKDNLLAASIGEQKEFTDMYPNMIATAREERNDRAERTFNWANKVEMIHHKLYDKMFQEVKAGQTQKDTVYYVCPVCGNTVEGSAPDKCPICGAPGSKFKKIE
jgi:rubrerythrin